MKEFEDALREQGNTAALEVLAALRERDKASRSARPARRITGRKMTPELAREIIHLNQTTEMTQQEIAFQLGVNQGRVNEVLKHGKWLDGDPNSPEAKARDRGVERAKEGVGIAPRPPRPRRSAPKAEVPAAAPVTAAPVTAAPAESAPEPQAKPQAAEQQAPEPQAVQPQAAEAAPKPERKAKSRAKPDAEPKAEAKPGPKSGPKPGPQQLTFF
nr:hypothetical protein [Azospirillum sp. SYSU D00513]